MQGLCIDKTLNLDNHEGQKCNSNSWRDLLGRKDLGKDRGWLRLGLVGAPD